MKHKFYTAVVTADTIQAIQLADIDGSLNKRLYEL